MQPVTMTRKIHEQLAQVVDNPSLLIVGPQDIAVGATKMSAGLSEESDAMSIDDEKAGESTAADSDEYHINTDLPLNAYEPIHKETKLEFLLMPPVQIETSEAERIAVDDIVKGSKEDDNYDLADSLTNQQNAIRMFHQRLKFVNEYVLSVRAAQQQHQNQIQLNYNTATVTRVLNETDHQLVRKINAFTSQLVKQRTKGFDSATQKQELDVIVAALLSTVVKGEYTKLDTNTVWASYRSFEFEN